MKLAPNPHLSDYLAEHVKAGIASHFALCASLDPDGGVVFYIHPASVSGRTEDFYTRPGEVDVFNKRALDALASMVPQKAKLTPRE
jgi:hypothetical protein